MGNQYENDEFKNAARAAGVKSKDALNDCSEKFHNSFQKYERSAMSFQEMKGWTHDWWLENSWKY